MAKQKKQVYICAECGHEEPKWLGRCPECGSWNTFQERTKIDGMRTENRREHKKQAQIVDFSGINDADTFRTATNISELDSVLGGGIAAGSAVLIGGEPGIGKSTLMLQMLASLRQHSCLYISGEESPRQIRHRADRLQLNYSHLHMLCDTRVETILSRLQTAQPDIVVIDSVQTLVSEELGAVPGTVNQIKYGCMELIDWAKENDAAVFLVGHVTKDGAIAGPKVIEHMVDTVLYFEQGDSDVRMLRAAKNRFGSVDEIGIFTMESTGLMPVPDPFSFFLTQRPGRLPPGITSAAIFEGSRSYIVEIQALTVPAKGSFSRVFAEGVDSNTVTRVAAVMEKHLKLELSRQDIYVNVAGGMRLHDVGVELPLAVAMYSAMTNKSLSKFCSSAGEISLAGELRPTGHIGRRYKGADDLGMHLFVGPPWNQHGNGGSDRTSDRTDEGAPKEELQHGKIRYAGCETLEDAVDAVFQFAHKSEK